MSVCVGGDVGKNSESLVLRDVHLLPAPEVTAPGDEILGRVLGMHDYDKDELARDIVEFFDASDVPRGWPDLDARLQDKTQTWSQRSARLRGESLSLEQLRVCAWRVHEVCVLHEQPVPAFLMDRAWI